MKAKFLILSGVLVFSACATGPSVYGPAQGRGLGFQEQQIENNRFQVSYTARTADEARNLSLLRAAELTQAQGYNYFRVIGSETSGQNARRSNVSTSVGVGVGSGGGYRRGTRTNVGIGIGIGDLGRALNGDKITASMEIIMQEQKHLGDDNIYDARSILETMRPHVANSNTH